MSNLQADGAHEATWDARAHPPGLRYRGALHRRLRLELHDQDLAGFFRGDRVVGAAWWIVHERPQRGRALAVPCCAAQDGGELMAVRLAAPDSAARLDADQANGRPRFVEAG